MSYIETLKMLQASCKTCKLIVTNEYACITCNIPIEIESLINSYTD